MTIVLNLPMPPSTNRLWRSTTYGQVYKDRPAKGWAKSAAWEVQIQRKGHSIQGPSSVLIEVAPRKKDRGDIDNKIKACLDVLKQGGAILDDKHVMSVTALWTADIESGIRVTIEAQKISPALQRAFSGQPPKPKRREICPTCGNAFDTVGRPTCDCDDAVQAPRTLKARAAA